jgi:ribonuclease G
MSDQSPIPAPPGRRLTPINEDELQPTPAAKAHGARHRPSICARTPSRTRRHRPLLQKILSIFKKEKGSFRELIINSEPLEKRVALLVDGTLDRFEIERESDNRMVGGIYKGRSRTSIPASRPPSSTSATKNAFLHYWDMLPAAADSSVEVVRVNKKKDASPRKAEPTVKDIPGLYPPGSEIVIQVTKGPIGTKGPRTTTNLSLPGRYLILMPFSDGCGISRKIEDPAERKRLKTLINELTIPEGMGVIVRTAGEGKKPRYFVRDLHLLLKKWEGIQRQDEERPRPRLPLPGARHRRAHRARLPHRGSRPRPHRQQTTTSARRNRRPDLQRSRGKIVSTRTASRSSSASTSSARSSRPSSARSRCRPAARSSSTRPRPSSPSTSTPAPISPRRRREEHHLPGQHGGRHRDRAPDPAPQHRRPDDHGLHRHEGAPPPQRGLREDGRAHVGGQGQDHILPISSLGIMQMTRQRQQESLSANLYTRLPVLPRPRHREVGHDDVGRAPAQALLGRPPPPGCARTARNTRSASWCTRASSNASAVEDAELLVRMEKTLRREIGLPRRPELPRRKLQNHKCQYE